MKEILKRVFIKLTSSKVIITIWSLIVISFIVFGKQTDFNDLAKLLCGIPLSYFAANVAQKAIDTFKKDEK